MPLGLPRVVIAHNRYRNAGGEDIVAEAEAELLRRYGHEVLTYGRTNEELEAIGKGHAAAEAVWSARTVDEIRTVISEFHPDIIHVHNTFPLISPSIFWAAAAAGVPSIQSLHNFRLLCPQAMFLRSGRVCEACLGKVPWRAVVHKCYRNSAAASVIAATMLTTHRSLGTYRAKVTRYIALNEFCRAKLIAGGLPPDRISVKPNFVDAPFVRQTARKGGLYVGRLAAEKGVAVLADALRVSPSIDVAVIGVGNESWRLQALKNASLMGWQPPEAIYRAMIHAEYLVLPSIWYESFPRTVVEAFAAGLPVIASRIGALAEIIEDGRTGLLFEPGASADLARKLSWAEANADALRRMGDAARAEYDAKYTPEANYRQLMGIYEKAISVARDQV